MEPGMRERERSASAFGMAAGRSEPLRGIPGDR